MQSGPNGHLTNVAILLYYINPERLQVLKKEIIQKFDRQKRYSKKILEVSFYGFLKSGHV